MLKHRLHLSKYLSLLLLLPALCLISGQKSFALSATYFVAPTGSDLSGDGSLGNPWGSITHAVNQAPDRSEILVQPGTYSGRVRLDQQFSQGVTVRSAIPYQAKLRHSGSQVVTAFYGQNITLEGFDIAHSPENTAALVFQIQDLLGNVPGVGNGSDPVVSYITLRNNIIHDSSNNDLLKVNNGARDIAIQGNMFFNQQGSDEHIDINSVVGVVVEGNVFFNYLPNNPNNTSSFIVVKDSNGSDDGVLGAERVIIRRNIFLNWQGSDGHNFILLGEDGKAYYEATDILVENNLLIGNASNLMRAAFGVKGGRDIIFRHNTVIGDLPARAFATRLINENANPINQNIHFYNNIWSDPAQTMGTEGYTGIDFAEVPSAENTNITLNDNLYWNGGDPIPSDPTQMIHFTDDANRVVANPLLGDQSSLVVPHWNGSAFADGSNSIQEAFTRLVELYGKPGENSAAIDAVNIPQFAAEDIRGILRGGSADIGAYETNPIPLIKSYLPLIIRH